MVLDGTPRDRGRIHGEALKPMILESLERWKYLLGQRFKKSVDRLIDQLVEKTNFLAAAKKWTPQLLDEVKGIAEGAGLDFNLVFALQLMDEWIWCLQSRAQNTVERCSSLGCFKEGDRPALVAQNLDWLNYIEGLGALLHIKYPESTLESLVPTVAGMIGTCGLNNRPLGICTNALWEFANNSIDGLPTTFIVRAVLEQPNLNTAVDFIHKIKHASAENYLIGDSEQVVDYECTANKISQYIPYEDAQRVYHTNHPLVNDDVIFPPKKPPLTSTTHNRFNYLVKRLKDPTKNITIETVKYILSSHEGSVCVHHNYQPLAGYTFCSVICSLSHSPVLHLAMGPPCSNEYKSFRF